MYKSNHSVGVKQGRSVPCDVTPSVSVEKSFTSGLDVTFSESFSHYIDPCYEVLPHVDPDPQEFQESLFYSIPDSFQDGISKLSSFHSSVIVDDIIGVSGIVDDIAGFSCGVIVDDIIGFSPIVEDQVMFCGIVDDLQGF